MRRDHIKKGHAGPLTLVKVVLYILISIMLIRLGFAGGKLSGGLLIVLGVFIICAEAVTFIIG
ncbi:hypothetical protein J4460_04995 [Candidatus Woesearchaeota archaeon]|nr:hypothetical protein [Candidatus Woesearchaeota archaeon]OGW44977.1 MAG: hypothetical protein A2X57_04870 [Nitrospirae bacterium GWD2_57_8]HIH38044.1 hypothetical protein [Candidatus Woesearchaeota archaeon]HIH48563.1 hypothetical protein [Candidatus Woesearchaeota archaeon]HIJ04256.1 hypothetical protein [Candidatus Woesearchaeota archaeon]